MLLYSSVTMRSWAGRSAEQGVEEVCWRRSGDGRLVGCRFAVQRRTDAAVPGRSLGHLRVTSVVLACGLAFVIGSATARWRNSRRQSNGVVHFLGARTCQLRLNQGLVAGLSFALSW